MQQQQQHTPHTPPPHTHTLSHTHTHTQERTDQGEKTQHPAHHSHSHLNVTPYVQRHKSHSTPDDLTSSATHLPHVVYDAQSDCAVVPRESSIMHAATATALRSPIMAMVDAGFRGLFRCGCVL